MLASPQSHLHAEAEESNHRQTAVLDLSGLQAEGALLVLRGQLQGVKVATCRRYGRA